MTLISNNLKYLRKQKGYTQQELADKVGIKRSLIGAYEEGRADPRIDTLIKIGKVMGLPVDALIKKDLAKLSPADIESLKEKSDKDKMKVLAITVDEKDRENIHLVPQRAAAGYLNGYSDPEYIKELPKFQLPMLPDNATYRAFEISGDSMLPIEPGTVVIGKYLEKLEDIKNGKTYVLVTSQEGIVFKRVFNYVKDRGKLFLVSDNKVYAPYDLGANEILEVWEAKAYISLTFPDPESREEVSLETLTKMVLELKDEIAKLKK